MHRRQFLHAAALAAATPALLRAADAKPPLRKALKWGMIGQGATILEKFQLIKELGFEGVEMYSPDAIDKQQVLAARDSTGIVIHGVVNGSSWDPRLSDPNPAVRDKALANLVTALHDCKLYGGTTTLLIPGKVADPQNENWDQVWQRSTEQIRKAEPVAKKLGVAIAIEVVWNDFIVNPDQFVKFVDQFDPAAVGAYFDPSNVTKYGIPPATWIRKLGKRMVKFDFKGYHLENGWVEIGQGSEDWPQVRKALDEVGYHGWATSEVKPGDREYLRKVSAQMDEVLYG